MVMLYRQRQRLKGADKSKPAAEPQSTADKEPVASLPLLDDAETEDHHEPHHEHHEKKHRFGRKKDS